MAIVFNCPGCGTRMQAPESLAGKSARCASCGLVIGVPEEALEAEEVPPPRPPPRPSTQAWDFDIGEPSSPPPRRDREDAYSPRRQQEDEAERRRPCPLCGEMILVNAVKCRYCGEVFGAGMTPAYRSGSTGGRAIASLVLGILALVTICVWWLSIPLAIIGLILGATDMNSPNRGMAVAGLVLSLVAIGLALLLVILFVAALVNF